MRLPWSGTPWLLTIVSLAMIATELCAADAELRRNIVLIVADDLGYSDLGAFGGEIDTPNLDRLAANGRRFTQFYTASTCSPTRAMLLTGVDHHRTGFGTLAEAMHADHARAPGYEGRLNDRVVTIAELFRAAGYATAMAGKWHLGLTADAGPAARGFDRSYAMTHGTSSHYGDGGYSPAVERTDYFEDGRRVVPPANFYSSDTFTDKLAGYIDASARRGRPFFAYLAFTAPHYPLHAPRELIEKYLPRYAEGWERVRATRVERLRANGLLGPTNLPAGPLAGVPAWTDLNEDERRLEIKRMAIYAAMVERLDYNVGLLLARLADQGVADDTIVVFMSDNGAEASELETLPALRPWFEKHFDNSYASLGTSRSFASYGPAWASVSATPFAWHKGLVAEGGVRSPLIIVGAGVHTALAGSRGLRTDAVTVADLAVTLLDLGGVRHPGSTFEGRRVHAPDGRSFRSLLEVRGDVEVTADVAVTADAEVAADVAVTADVEVAADARDAGRIVHFESFGTAAALLDGRWKALRIGAPWGDGEWRLFDLLRDPAEIVDLAAEHGGLLARLVRSYERYAADVGVQPLAGAPLAWGFSARFPKTCASEYVLGGP